MWMLPIEFVQIDMELNMNYASAGMSTINMATNGHIAYFHLSFSLNRIGYQSQKSHEESALIISSQRGK